MVLITALEEQLHYIFVTLMIIWVIALFLIGIITACIVYDTTRSWRIQRNRDCDTNSNVNSFVDNCCR